MLVAAAPVLTLMGWRVLLADLGTHLPAAPASSVFLVGQLGKYLPGSVWTVVAQTEMGARLTSRGGGWPSSASCRSGSRCSPGCLLGIPAIPRLVDRESQAFSWWWVVLAVVLGGVLLWPRLLNAVIARGLRVLRREPLEHELSGRRDRPDLGVVRRGLGVDRASAPSSWPAASRRTRRSVRCS